MKNVSVKQRIYFRAKVNSKMGVKATAAYSFIA